MTVKTHGTPTGYQHGCRCDRCSAAKGTANEKRDMQGVIATLRDLATGATFTLHVSGYVWDATAIVCDRCDELDPNWCVQSLSTPRSIMRDLSGDRGIDKNGKVTMVPPELLLLSQVHRRDLLAPELVAGSSDERHYGRRARS